MLFSFSKVVWHIDLLGCMHTKPQGYIETYKHRSTAKEVGYRAEGEAAYKRRGNIDSAWISSLMTSINKLVLPGKMVCRFILLS